VVPVNADSAASSGKLADVIGFAQHGVHQQSLIQISGTYQLMPQLRKKQSHEAQSKKIN
jgi:hypothetical protein